MQTQNIQLSEILDTIEEMGDLSESAMEAARGSLASAVSARVSVDMSGFAPNSDMICGGGMEVLCEVLSPRQAEKQSGDSEAGVVDPRCFAADQQCRQYQQAGCHHRSDPRQHRPQLQQDPQQQFLCAHTYTAPSFRYSSICSVNSLCWCL